MCVCVYRGSSRLSDRWRGCDDSVATARDENPAGGSQVRHWIFPIGIFLLNFWIWVFPFYIYSGLIDSKSHAVLSITIKSSLGTAAICVQVS